VGSSDALRVKLQLDTGEYRPSLEEVVGENAKGTEEMRERWVDMAKATQENVKAVRELREAQQAYASSGSTADMEKLAQAMQNSADAAERLRSAQHELKPEIVSNREAINTFDNALQAVGIRYGALREARGIFGEMSEMLEGWAGAALGASAAAAVLLAELYNMGAEFADEARQVKTMSEMFDVSTDMYQLMSVEAQKLGLDSGFLTYSLRALTYELAQGANASKDHQEAMKRLGVDGITSADQAIRKLAEGMSTAKNPMQFNADLMLLLRRGGLILKDVLADLGTHTDEYIDKAKEENIIIGENALKMGTDAFAAVNDLKEGMEGLTHTIGEIMSPEVESLSKDLKTDAEIIGSVVIPVVKTLATVWTMVTFAIKGTADVLRGVWGSEFDAIKGMAAVASDIGHWDKMKADAKEAAENIKNDWENVRTSFTQDAVDMVDAMDKIWNGPPKGKEGPAALPGKIAPKPDKGPITAEMKAWEEQLDQLKAVQAGQRAAEVQHWMDVIETDRRLGTLDAATLREIEKKIADARKTDAVSDLQDEINFWTAKLAVLKGQGAIAVDAAREVEEKIAGLRRSMVDKETENERTGLAALTKVQEEAEKRDLDDFRAFVEGMEKQQEEWEKRQRQAAEFAKQTADAEIAARREQINREAEMGTISKGKKLEELKELRDEEYDAQMEALEADLDTYKDNYDQYQATLEKMKVATIKYDQDIKDLNSQMVQNWQQGMMKMTDSVNTAFFKWTSGQERFRYAWVGMWSGLVNTAFESLVKMLEKKAMTDLAMLAQHKATQTAMTAEDAEGAEESQVISKTTGIKQIMIDAKQAAAGAYSAVSGIPVIGPLLAPEAAAAAFAATMAFGSFDRGGMAEESGLAMIHQSEIIMPPSVAGAFKTMAEGGGFGGNHSISISQGPVQALDARGVDKVLMRRNAEVARVVQRMVRNAGALSRGAITRR
jgi:hypothetical protein